MVLFLIIIVLLSANSSLSVCPDLPFVTNGSITYSEMRGNGYPTGTLALHTCDEGYLLSYETLLRVCQNDSSWSGQSIWCVSAAINCLALDDIPNGNIVYIGDDDGLPPFNLNTAALHSCSDGSILTGITSRVCVVGGMSNGEWNGTAPSCSYPDPCLSVPCDPNARCTRNGTVFTCTCGFDYSGDGFTCTSIEQIGSYVSLTIVGLMVLMFLSVGVCYGCGRSVYTLLRTRKRLDVSIIEDY